VLPVICRQARHCSGPRFQQWLRSPLRRSFNSYIDYPNRGQSYEVQHDEFHNSDTPNRFLAYGALVGGPGADDKYVLLCISFSTIFMSN
jgi:hypothetical protein